VLYRHVLARLPERAAIAIGQWGLRHLPLDRLALFRNPDPRLAVTLGGVRLANPLILSSMYYDTAILRRAMGLGWGAVTAKSITPGPRPGHPEPTLVRVQTAEGPGLVNCNGFRNPGLAAYRRALAGLAHRVPLIVAAAGESADDYVRVVEGLEEFGDLVEINISSPNTKLVYGWSTRPSELKDLFRAVRAATARPPGGQRGDHDPGRARRRDHHRELRQHPAGRRAPALPADRRAVGAGPLRDHARERPPGPGAVWRPPRDHRNRGHRHPGEGAAGARGGGAGLRDLHRIHHARAALASAHPRCAASRREITHRLSTYPQPSTIAEKAHSDALRGARHEKVTL
jgi:hypothetical protein